MTSPERGNQIGETLEEKTSGSPHERQSSTTTFQIESTGGGVQGTIQQNQDNAGHSEQTHELVQLPATELPRLDEVSGDIIPSGLAQPSKKLRCTQSTSNTLTVDTNSKGKLTRRSARIATRGVNRSIKSGTESYCPSWKRPLYLTHKKDDYIWFHPSADEDDE